MSDKSKVWVLTEEYNDYDQHGAYFVVAFAKKPTLEQLLEHTDTYCSDVRAQLAFCLHLQNGGGRRDNENSWYYLTQEELL